MRNDDDLGRCELLGPFALLVQASLGALAVLSLLLKRQREVPRRPIEIWFFDVSKQIFGAVVIHFVNIAMANFAGGGDAPESISPCVWYFLNVLVDTTIGVPILWFALKMLDSFCDMLGLTGTKSGDYGGRPPKAIWWLKQSCVYTFGLMLMKCTVFTLLKIIPQLGNIGEFMLRWTNGSERLRIFFVMFYILIDNFLKGSPTGEFSGQDDSETSEPGSGGSSQVRGRTLAKDDDPLVRDDAYSSYTVPKGSRTRARPVGTTPLSFDARSI